MKKHKTEILIGIIFAIIFSPFPDYVLKPLIVNLSGYFVYAINIFSKSIADTIYQNVARGDTHDLAGLIISATAFFVLFPILGLGSMIQRLSGRTRDISGQIASLSERDMALSQLPVPQGFRQRISRKMRQLFIVFAASSFAGMIMISTYEVTASGRVRQYMLAAEPYLSDQELKSFHSRSATIKNRADYISLIDDLRKKMKDNGLYLP